MRIIIAAVLAALLTVSGSAQEFIADPGAPASAFPNPDRPVADIVSPIWHNEKERDVAGEPRQLVRLLGIKSGMTVADIGAGSGYYVVRLSLIVGPRGRVIAEDVVPEYLRGLRRRVRDLGLQNVAIGLGEPHDPRLPTDSLDVAILAHMYHEIAQPYALLYNLIPALKPGARVGSSSGHSHRGRRNPCHLPGPPHSAGPAAALVGRRFRLGDGDRQALAYVYFEAEPGRRTAAGLLTRDEARRIVAPGMADGQSWPSFCGSISAVRS